MGNLIDVITLEEIKEIQAKILFSRTDKVTKISDGSVLNGILFGTSKTAQKALKDIVLVQSHFFPKTSYGQYLDNIAVELLGVAPRFGPSKSSTYIRVHASNGTIYTAGSQKVTGSHGIVFNLVENVTIGVHGFAYIKVESNTSGENTNVDALTLDTMINAPANHEYVINDFKAIGGRDIENDETFRQRLLNAYNIAATGTIKKLEQIFLSINSNVLRLFNQGTDGNGKLLFSVASQNGSNFSASDFDDLLVNSERFLNSTELRPNGLGQINIVLQNISWYNVDISLRAKIKTGFNPDEIRKNMQVRMSSLIDYRVWRVGQKVEWDDLLFVAKNTEGVDYVLDPYFVPSTDILIPLDQLPRIRGFELRDLNGNILSNATGSLSPVFFPASLDFNFIQTVLADL